MGCVKDECGIGIEVLSRANGRESNKFSAEINAVRAGMIMSADDKFNLASALVLDYVKHLIGIFDDMPLFYADIKALMAKYPKAAAFR